MSEPNLTQPTLSPAEFKDFICKLYDHKAESIFLVFSRDLKSHVRAPGLNRPWATIVKRHAEEVAKETGGVVVSLADGIKHMYLQSTTPR